MTDQVTFPLGGQVLLSHLAAYGLGVVLEAVGVDAYVGHDPELQSFDPIVRFDAERQAAIDAITASAAAAGSVIEEDLEPGKTGNDRRSVIWARASFANDTSRAVTVLRRRAAIVDDAERRGDRLVSGLLAGLGAPAAWGSDKLKPSEGATALDGVLGNHTSDFVRGVLRPACAAAAALTVDPFDSPPADDQLDKTGWAPPGTKASLVHQWLAALGLCLLPVAHRQLTGSATPTCWQTTRPRRHGITLPVFAEPVSLPRLRAVLGLEALTVIHDVGPLGDGPSPGEAPRRAVDGDDDGAERRIRAVAELRALGIDELVIFERRYQAGAGSSVAFTHGRGRHVLLR